MRSKEFLYETIEVISEKTSSDELIQFLEPLGFEVEKKTGTTVKVVVPSSLRGTGVQQIAGTLPGSTVSDDNKKVYYDGATILVKPAEAQGGRLEKEEGQIIALDSSIKEHLNGRPSIKLAVGTRVVDAAGVVKVPGNVKADAAIVDASGQEVAWISLKDGTTPLGFGQWGGVNHLANNPEIQRFVEQLAGLFGKEFPRGPTYGRPIKDPKLKALVCFGKNYGQAPGISNVDLILQGHPTLKKGTRGSYVITGAHSWYNGDIPTGEYDPVLTVRFSSDRNDFGITGARITAYPTKGRPWQPVDSPKTKSSPKPVATPALKAPTTAPAPQPASIQNMKKPLGTSKIPMGADPTPQQPQ
jgi:hypothetical protein